MRDTRTRGTPQYEARSTAATIPVPEPTRALALPAGLLVINLLARRRATR